MGAQPRVRAHLPALVPRGVVATHSTRWSLRAIRRLTASVAFPRWRQEFGAPRWRAGTLAMTAPFVDIDPEAILVRIRVETSRWHIVDSKRLRTWCGLLLSEGSMRRPLSETPEDRRCETCISRFGEDVVRSPVT